MIEIDGSKEEGGGQILRTALALSILTQLPFRAINIRKGREQPGLKAQHLHAIKTLEKLSKSTSVGAELGSLTLEFYPKEIAETRASINVGTAGSVALIMQALLLPLCRAKKPVTLSIKGGTDTKWATPIDSLSHLIIPHLREFGEVKIDLIKRGYFPKGGGEVEIKVIPSNTSPKPFNLTAQGKIIAIEGIVHASEELQKQNVAERLAQGAQQELSKICQDIRIKKEYGKTDSIGCVITLVAKAQHTAIGSDALGEVGVRAEDIGKKAAQSLIAEIESGAVIDCASADWLIPYLAIAKGTIKTSKITPHMRANAYAVEQFLGKCLQIDEKNAVIKAV